MKCPWTYGAKDNIVKYHDEVWCKEVHDEQIMFHNLCLVILQCGLRWQLILDKQASLENAFAGFNYLELAKLDNTQDLNSPINNPRKIQAILDNAQNLMRLHASGITLENLVWSCNNFRVMQHSWTNVEQIPSENELSRQVAKKLRLAGFKFIGPKSAYAYLQLIGMINDHLVTCEKR